MENLNQVRQALEESFAAMEQLFNSIDDTKINHKPTEKWSFGEEMVHITMSTNGTGMLLSSPDDRLIPSDHLSRSYADIVTEYQEKLALNPNIGRSIADNEPKVYSGAALKTSFLAAAQSALQALENWDEAKSDQWMVWKHPLLGKMTAREMMYFTVHHTRHHLGSLRVKAK